MLLITDIKRLIIVVVLSALAIGQTKINYIGGVKNKPIIDVRDYGSICDGLLHPLSSIYGSLAAAQAVYPFITSLGQQRDYAAIKAAANVAFGSDGSEHGTNTQLNKPLLLPAGTCMFANDTLLIRNASGIRIEGAGKTTTILQGNKTILAFDGLWYSELSNFEILETTNSAIAAMDVDGNVPGHPYPTRSVQGNLLKNLLVSGGASSYALAFCRQGGNTAQCSEDIMINVHLSNASSAGLYINGFNALDNVWIGGDIQAYTQHGIYLNASTLREIGVSFEPAPGCGQLNNIGYDIYSLGGVSGSVIAIGSRSEGFSFMNISNNKAYVAGFTQNAALSIWAGNATVISAEAIEKTGTDGKIHLFCATTPGTSGGIEPTWPASGTVADGTAVWTKTSFAAITLQQGNVDFPSSRIDPAGTVDTGLNIWQFGTFNNPNGWFISDYVSSTFTEQNINSQSLWGSFYVNPQGISEPSNYQPNYSMPAGSVGVLLPSTTPFVVGAQRAVIANSSMFELLGSYQSAPATFAADFWGLRNVLGGGTNGTSTLTLSHTGSLGTTIVDFTAAPFKVTSLVLNTLATPTCDASHQGQFNYVAGGPSIKDIVQVCAKDAGDMYAWRVIF